MTPADRVNALLKFYDEQASQARQHENQRQQMTAIVLTLASAVTGFITYAKFAWSSWPAALAVILLGVYGWAFSRKHYERNQMHTSVMSLVRGAVDAELAGKPQPFSLEQLRLDGENDHYKNYPRKKRKEQTGAKSTIARMGLHPFWEMVHVGVVLMGTGLLVAILVHRTESNPPTEIRIIP